MNWKQKRDWLQCNPVTVARHIDYICEKLWGTVLLSGAHPIGQILNYELRKERQVCPFFSTYTNTFLLYHLHHTTKWLCSHINGKFHTLLYMLKYCVVSLQGRGTAHFHSAIHVQGAPRLNVDCGELLKFNYKITSLYLMLCHIC